MIGQNGKGQRHIFILHQDIIRNVQINIGKIPNGFHAAVNQQIADLLSARPGHGDDPHMDPHTGAQVADLFQRQHLAPADLRTDQPGVDFKSGDNIQPVMAKPLIGEQRLTHFPHAYQNRLVCLIIAKKRFQLMDKLCADIAHLRSAGAADNAQILAHHHMIQMKRFRNGGSRDILGAIVR